jgi:hypothetical protein
MLRNRYKWIAGTLACGALMLAPAAAVADCTADLARTEIRLFKYSGVESSAAKDQFSRFYGIVNEKLMHLRPGAPGLKRCWLDQVSASPEVPSSQLIAPIVNQ